MDKEQEEYLKSDNQRTANLIDDLAGIRDVDDLMLGITEVLTETEIIPDAGRYYTFIYAPKTPRIEYDQFPLIACAEIFQWGFRGYNYHWGFQPRNYSWNEVVGSLHLVYPREVEDLRSIP